MAYERTKMRLGSELAPIATPLRTVVRARTEERRELEMLRATNARLLQELSELKEREAQALQLADRDGLTGLFNRRRMLELLDVAITEASAQWQHVGLLFIDLNGFKGVNDEYGHATGDKVLITAAARISARVRIGDFVGRYGGDEFVVVLPNMPDRAAVTWVADMIRERVALPYWIRSNEQHLTAAVGEAMYPQDGETTDELLNRADHAMYRMKARLARPIVSLGSNLFRHRWSRRRDD